MQTIQYELKDGIATLTFDEPDSPVNTMCEQWQKDLTEATAQVVKDMGWQVAANLPDEGRIEATSVSEWFGLKDDIVIRIAATEDGGAVLDIRAAAREGDNDRGANAARVRAFIAALR